MSTIIGQVPNLTTALTGPLQLLEKKFLSCQSQIEAWLRSQWQLTPAPFYSSVDLRNAGFKVAPVDTNLFPAGFNNLNPDFLPLCVQALQATLDKNHPGCLRILIVPENHSRNMFYYENLARLYEIINKAGFEVRIGSFNPELTAPINVSTPSGSHLTVSPLLRENNRVMVRDYTPCLVILNNDLSEGIPEILQNIEQPILPSLHIGWSTRLKSNHFRHYDAIAKEFAALIGINPWLIAPLFTECEGVNFVIREGEEELADKVQYIRQLIREKYQQYQIELDPFITVKADSGTYGMGVMMVKDPDEIRKLNRKERTRMSVSKGGQKVQRVLVQEGVYTFETVGQENAVAEPVIYMIGQHVVGGFYRVHTERNITENLNAPGMRFEPLAFATACNTPEFNANVNCQVNRFYTYGVIARLACLAAARELKSLGTTAL